MALPDIDKITQELNRRFAAPLPEFYKRRIIFWYDEDREFEDQIGEMDLVNAKVIALTGSNSFVVKKTLVFDEPETNFLVYSPIHYDSPEDNWLINIELYSEEFRADLNSIWMDEMGLPNNPMIRKLVRGYSKFFKSADRRKSIAAMSNHIANASQLHLAVMASICGLKTPSAADIIRGVLSSGMDVECNSIYQEFVKYGADTPFRVMVAQATGYSEADSIEFGRLATHIMLSAVTRTMRSEYLAGLDAFISYPHQAFCYDLISEWLHDDAGGLYEIARFVEYEARLDQRFGKLAVEDLVDTDCFPCVNECILQALMNDIGNYIISIDTINAVVEKRRTMVWYEEVACYYEGLQQVANMQAFFHEHAAGFHLAQSHEIWKAYTSDYYRMDTYYRLYHLCFSRSLSVSNEKLDDLFKVVTEKVEALYNGWFLNQLSSNWTNVCEEELATYGYIMEVSRQNSFYSSKVVANNNRVFVIISDAMRYEVAASLTEQLRREMQSKVTLDSVQAVFPTITKFGMAALLPHSKLTTVPKANGGLSVLADGASTEMPNRDKILKAKHGASVALQYKNIIKLKRAERQALVKGMEIVYIYHDKIDEASHTADNLVFGACDDAIAEIKTLVRIICNDFGGTRILITADHGFLYTYSPLSEDEKVSKASFNDMDIEYGRRYAVMQENASPDYLMPVKYIDAASGYSAFTPRENIRIKMNGGGLNFVHGGISLQEMVVPVIDYQFLRNANKTYQRNKDKYDTKPVSLSLLSANRKISNMIFSLNFYQNEAVGDNRSSCNYLLYFVDATGKQISDTARIIADKTEENNQDRTFRCSFNLKSLKYSKHDSYYLMIVDESGLQAPQREEFQIDIAFAMEEFNFF